MKRVICLLAAISIMCSLMVFPSFASEPPKADLKEYVEVIPDGDEGYYVIKIIPSESKSTKGGTKEISYYSSYGLAWVYRVHGDFFYNGSTSYATGARASYTIYESGWSCTASSSWYSGNTAYASGTFKKGLTTKYATPSISCSASGGLS